MTYSNDEDLRQTLAKLAQSRAAILDILEPPPEEETATASTAEAGGGFPRSRTMRLLLSGRGIGTVGAVLGGLAIARPALAFRLLRMLPVGALARMVLVKAIYSLRSASKRRPRARGGDSTSPS